MEINFGSRYQDIHNNVYKLVGAEIPMTRKTLFSCLPPFMLVQLVMCFISLRRPQISHSSLLVNTSKKN